MVWRKMLWNTTLATALASGLLILGGATIVRADDYDSCHRNVEKWESRLDRDTDRHGVYSRQANHDREELTEARQHCERKYGYGRHDHSDHDADDSRQNNYDRR
jgi:hypothetical protein